MTATYIGVLVVAAAVALTALSMLYWRSLILLEDSQTSHQAHLEALAEARRAEKEVELLRASCVAAVAEEEVRAAREASLQLPALKPCEAQTLYAPPGGPPAEMDLVREHLQSAHGWREVRDPEVAAFVLANGDAPPVKRPCARDFQGVRIPGTFERELEVCQKHKLFERLADRHGIRDSGPGVLVERWPWLPKTYLLDRASHVAALNATLPCMGAQESLIVKGDAHGGRAVWLPPTNEELRALLGLPCPPDGVARPAQLDHPPRLAQEMVRSLLWDGASVMGRVLFVVQRRGQTRLSTERGRWSLGTPAPSYELQMFDTPLFTQFGGHVRDLASEGTVGRRNASEFEAFIQAESARQGRRLPGGWVRGHFMRQAGAIAAEAFAASSTPWAWELPSSVRRRDASDAVKAASLEPDGAFLFLAAELLVDGDFQVRLIEFTCVPGDIHGLREHFETLPWTRAFARDLAMQMARLLLRNSGQDAGPAADSGEAGRWTKVAERGPFPHP